MHNSNTYVILLWLEAPLQSWGSGSMFDRRETELFPTKSGVTGILCSALGASGEQRDFLESMSNLKQTSVSYVIKNIYKRLPTLRDFHMVGSGYDKSDKWEKLHIPKTSDGKNAVGGGTKLTYRYYLQNAKFAVILEVPGNEADRLESALTDPVFDFYLGRKCCIPADFVFRGVFENFGDALKEAEKIAEAKGLVENFRVIDAEEGTEPEDEVIVINDVPVQFGTVKKYRDRKVMLVRNNTRNLESGVRNEIPDE